LRNAAEKKLTMTKRKTDPEKLELVFQEMKKNKLKLTEPRKLIVEVLFENHGPFGAEDLHDKYLKRDCDLATVYRTLTSLEQAKVIKRCDFGDGVARYELLDHEGNHHHHHLVCTGCKKIEVVDHCDVDHSIDRFAKKRGFKEISHSLEFFGVCPECQVA
jgi:Fur family ferric uptake transcriptional regulator